MIRNTFYVSVITLITCSFKCLNKYRTEFFFWVIPLWFGLFGNYAEDRFPFKDVCKVAACLIKNGIHFPWCGQFWSSYTYCSGPTVGKANFEFDNSIFKRCKTGWNTRINSMKSRSLKIFEKSKTFFLFTI